MSACVEKHGLTGADAHIYVFSQRKCERLAREIDELKESVPSFIRYRNALYGLDVAQLEAFERIKIEYQARIGNYFNPATARHYLSELTMLIFSLEAIDTPNCLIGVGTGFAPRHKMSGVAA